MSVGFEGHRTIPLEAIVLSSTGSQAERRKHFDKAAIEQLAESIKTVGLINPVVARPRAAIEVVKSDGGKRWYPAYKRKSIDGHNLIGGGFETQEAAELEADSLRAKQGFELVAGERRYLAHVKAGLSAINATVRELTDAQVLEVQLIENLQREGLHELAEAEGYEQLQQASGFTAEEIADKLGKSKAYVYSRLKLLALGPAARKAFYEGKLSASTALLLARIPVDSLQLQALKEITADDRWNGPMSVRQATDHVHENYTTRLDSAGFPTEDASLVPAAGTCGACPKRTGNQPELFGDIKRADVCTDPACFRSKREASAQRAIAAAKETGQRVISGKEAKKVAPNGTDRMYSSSDYVKLTDRSQEDPKGRSNAQLLGKGYVPTLLQDPETGILVKVAPRGDIKTALKDAGVKPTPSGSPEQSREDKRRKLEKRFRAAVYAEMRDKFPTKLGPDDVRTIALRLYEETTNDHQKMVLGLWQLEPVKSKNGYGIDCRKPAADLLASASDELVVKFLFDLVFIKDLVVYSFSNSKPTLLMESAKKLKVNADKIRAELVAAAKPKKAAKSKAKKK